MNNYKSTLYLPETNFPMRGDLANKEPQRLQHWYHDNLYSLIRKVKKGKKIFFLHDGPPYANGALHIGHAVNKILKDIIIKSKTLEGFDCPYIPGWDCHGLPIELNVEKLIGKPGNTVSLAEFRQACRNYATKQISNQKKDFIRMGVIADWDNPYLTMDFKNEAQIIRILGKIIAHGYLVKGIKPVPWCIDCGSALSDAEVIHKNFCSQAIDVAFYAVNIEQVQAKFKVQYLNSNKKIALLVWTTTPWTLPANQALSVDAQGSYQLIQITNERLIIIAKSLSNKIRDRLKKMINYWHVLGETLGSELEFMHFYHPFFNFTVPVLLSNHVTLDMGTGIVHIAPSHGMDDYIVCKKNNISPINLIKANGCYKNNTHPELDGILIFKANNIIINILKKNGVLLHIQDIQHSYAHCWRHNSPLIFRTTEQWFINMEHKKLREKSIDSINKIQWIPSWGKTRLKVMIANRPDWCISRQRTWGVPIPLFIHKESGKLHPNTLALIEEIANLVEKKGIQAWWDLLPIDIYSKYDLKQYQKNFDTLDVWFDSGCSTNLLINTRPELNLKISDIYLEGSDQYRGWFMSSLIISMAIKDHVPCKTILTHGFAVDSNRKKMSKSCGNIISPQTLMNKWGADIMRLWIASTDYSKEITLSEEIINRSADNYRRIRNTVRFLLANLKDFQPQNQIIPPKQMIRLDNWILEKTQLIQQHIINAYKQYDFHSVVHNIMQFCSIELGSFYLDIVKDRLYTIKKESLARRSCQTVIFYIAEAIVRWLAPILSFTADEIWNYLPGKRSRYVFTEEWFNFRDLVEENNSKNHDFFNELVTVRYEINKVFEKARQDQQLRDSLSVGISIYTIGSIAEKLKLLGSELKFFLLTSSAEIMDYELAPVNSYKSESISKLKFFLYKASGTKCLRCWHYTTDIGQNSNFPELCGRCVNNIIGKGEIRHFV
ncbi:MAG: isoleucine--tRNA ligase [Candidatus Dasytiphilus stammeri]